ncbi:MAG: histidine ammonia-lyase [Bacilli bacterium]|nr:histidine ammonia-lyase [Bacilli bacterium]MBN2876355.1 histidine ammonia-lyase [Bacilli bacterium]
MVEINGSNLTLDSFSKVVLDHEELQISDTSKTQVNNARLYVKEVIKSEVPTYGINTGFGKLSVVSIAKEDVNKLQENLLKSHACGVGEPFSEEVVRGMLLLRINALIKGYSGIRLSVIEKMVEFLNKNLIPIVYSQGSLGASGDLAPLSHMALPLLGLGEVYYQGKKMEAKNGLELAGITPIEMLEAKEGLSLINGTQAMTSVAALALLESYDLMCLSEHVLGLTMEALTGIDEVFYDKIHLLRNQPGQIKVAKTMRGILKDSKLTTKQGELRVQDAYSLRCSPQVLGASLDAIDYCRNVVENEMNAVTDNPLVFIDDQKVISAGNFHGQPIAIAMDFLAIAMSELANISERRIERMVNTNLSNGLPAFLVHKPGINSGFMIVQYSAASLVSENKALAHPASVDSIPSSANQEDHVSMGTISARKTRDIINNSQKVIAMELFTACQALNFRDLNKLSSRSKEIYTYVRKEIPFIQEDTIMYKMIHSVIEMTKRSEFKQLINLECD